MIGHSGAVHDANPFDVKYFDIKIIKKIKMVNYFLSIVA